MKGKILALVMCAFLVAVMVPGEAKAIQVGLDNFCDIFDVLPVGPYAHGTWYYTCDGTAGPSVPMIGLKNLPESVFLGSSPDGVQFWGLIFNLDGTFQTVITDGVNIDYGPEDTWHMGWPAEKGGPSLTGP